MNTTFVKHPMNGFGVRFDTLLVNGMKKTSMSFAFGKNRLYLTY